MDARCASAVYYNGRIYTLEDGLRTARAMAIADGKVVALGNDSDVKRAAPRGCDRFDLGGKAVVPGFIDCHTHFISMGIDMMNVDLSRTRSMAEAIALMKDAARRIPEGGWVIGAGWKESGWREGRFITAKDLDECCPRHKAVAHRVCMHMAAVNTLAMKELGIDPKAPGVETDAGGRPTGVLKEGAIEAVRGATAPDRAMKMKALTLATKRAHSLGVTSVQDNGDEGDVRIYRSAERSSKLAVRVWFNTRSDRIDCLVRLGLTTGIGSDLLKLGGLKVFCDGALGARTAALSEAYVDDKWNKGMFVHSRKELDDILTRANEAEVQLAVHAIGDSGIEAVVSGMRAALERCPRKDHRHRIEHLELPTMRHLKEMHRLKVIASMQPNFIGEWGGTEGMYVDRLGRERASRNNPFREVLDAKVKLVFGSDCMPFSPIYGIQSAVGAPYKAQRISVQEAVAAYTRDAAFASFEEHEKGTLGIGKNADFVVLSEDPFSEPDRIQSVVVVKTVLGGNVMYERSRKE